MMNTFERASAVGNIRCSNPNGVMKALCVDHNVSLYSGDILASVVTLFLGSICVFHRLRISDAKLRQDVSALLLSEFGFQINSALIPGEHWRQAVGAAIG